MLPLRFRTKVNGVFALTLVVLAVFGYFSIQEIGRIVGAEHSVSHAYEVLEISASLSSNLSQAVAARRGFLLLGDSRNLDQLATASTGAANDVQALRKLTSDNAAQQELLRQLDLLIGERLTALKKSVEARQTLGAKSDAATQAAFSRQGLELQERISDLQRNFREDESALLAQRMETAAVAVRKTLELETILAVSFFAALLAAIVSVNREISLRERAQSASEEAENLVRSVLDGSADAILVCDRRGRVILRNSVMSRYHASIPSSDPPVEDWPWLFGVYQRDKKTPVPAAELPLVRAAFYGESIDNSEVYLQPPGWETGRWHLASSRPLLDSAGHPRGGVVVLRDINERRMLEEDRDRLITELYKSLASIKTLTGLLPICAGCKKIRNDQGYWTQVEDFIAQHSDATFTHGLCPDCVAGLYPEVSKKPR